MLRLEIRGDLASTDAAATEVGAFARGVLVADRAGCVEIALSEALSNIVRHALAHTSGGTILMDATATEDGLRVSLTDRGQALPQWLLENQPPSAEGDVGLAESGRGLSLIYRCSDEVQFRHAGGVNYLRMHFRGRK